MNGVIQMTKKEFVELFGKKAELKTKVEAEKLTLVTKFIFKSSFEPNSKLDIVFLISF